MYKQFYKKTKSLFKLSLPFSYDTKKVALYLYSSTLIALKANNQVVKRITITMIA